MSVCRDFLQDCKECFETSRSDCLSFTIVSDLTPSDPFFLVLRTKTGDFIITSIVIGAGGEITIDPADYPAGLINEHAGKFRFVLSVNSSNVIPVDFEVGGEDFNCILAEWSVICCESNFTPPTDCEKFDAALDQDDRCCVLEKSDYSDAANIVCINNNPTLTDLKDAICPASPSGIAYQKAPWSGQITSFANFDAGFRFAAGEFNYTPPVLPIHMAELDKTTNDTQTLKNNNVFGNKNRFTSTVGDQDFTIPLVVDNLTGDLWGLNVVDSTTTWTDNLTTSDSVTIGGITNFRVPTQEEYAAILVQDFATHGGFVMNVSPLNYIANKILVSGTTSPHNAAGGAFKGLVNFAGEWSRVSKASTNGFSYFITKKNFLV